MTNEVPFVTQLRNELVKAAERLFARSADVGARSVKSYRHHPFLARIIFWNVKSSDRSDIRYMGQATKRFCAPVAPTVGQFLIEVANVGERPLTDHLRIDRVELRPKENNDLRVRGNELSVTAVVNVHLDDIFDTTAIEEILHRDNWQTHFSGTSGIKVE